MVTDASGTKLAEMGTFPYGEYWYNASNDKLLFTTYERDSESGNDYAEARYNVSGLARFSSPDAIAGSTSDPQSFNRYSYVRNMPVMLTDPTGMIPGCTTVRNRAPEASSSDADRTGGPSASDFSADPPPQAGCGGGTPCEYTLAGCAGGFGGPGGAAGLDGGFSGDDSGMAPTFGIGQSPGIGGLVFVPTLTFVGWGYQGETFGSFWIPGFDMIDYANDWQSGGNTSGGAPDRQKKFQDCLKKFGDKYAQSNLTLQGFDAATAAAGAAGIEGSALLSLWENESKLSPAFGPPGPKGEIGPIQIRPGVVSELGKAGILPQNWNSNLQANLTAGALYYDRLTDHYGIPENQAAAAYNGGPYGYNGKRAQAYQSAFNASQPGFINLINCMR
jgi:RHS repeat-associated protein